MKDVYEIAVIGGGIAGYSAALTLKSLRADYIWLGEQWFGEKLISAEYVRNFPSFSGSGEMFASALSNQAHKEGVELISARVDGVYFTDDGYLLTMGQNQVRAKSVILASGVSLTGEVTGEREFLGRGVSYCAVCDGALYRGKSIAAVLTSSHFADEVEYLASFAERVYAVCAEKEISFQAKNVVVVQEKPRAIEGGMRVERLILQTQTLDVSGVFFLKSATPPSALVGGLQTKGAHVVVERDLSTNLPGLFAAGDVTGTPYQYVKAAGEGNVAAYSAVAYCKKSNRKE